MATPPTFSAGAVLTAAQVNQVGLWGVIPSSATNGTVGSNGAVTIGNAVSSVTVNGAFSADFENYVVIISGGAGSTTGTLSYKLGSATTSYYASYSGYTFAGAALVGAAANTSNTYVGGEYNSGGINSEWHVYSPQLSKTTSWNGSAIQQTTTGYGYNFYGYLNDATSYTSFTVTPNVGTFTGGTIRIYGYNKG